MSTTGTRMPPGPKGLPLLGLVLEIRKDPLGTLQRVAKEFGDVVSLPVLGKNRILVNRPEYIQQLFLLQHAKLHKSTLTKQAVQPLLGDGLLTSEGDFWRQQRRLAQPAFHRARVNEYEPTMVECAIEQASKWRDGETRNIAEEMMQLTLEVAVQTLFGTSLASESQKIGNAMTFLMRHYLRRARTPWSVPESWPTQANRLAKRDREYMDSLVYKIIEERKNQTQPRKDLLWLLMAAMNEDGSRMTAKQLRDETMTLFLAGHETTALALGWNWYLLSENPAAETKLHAELDAELHGKPAGVNDLERLPYLQAAVKESLRLYPPAFILARTNISPVNIGDFEIAAGTTILASQWVTHRDARYFEQPEMFRPERWLDGLEERLAGGTYYPFGDGPRRCIGQGFALLELTLVIAAIAQKFRFKLVPGSPIDVEPLITLRPRYGIPMTIHAR